MDRKQKIDSFLNGIITKIPPEEVIALRNLKKLEEIHELPAKVIQIWEISSVESLRVNFLLTDKGSYSHVELSKWDNLDLLYIPYKKFKSKDPDILQTFTKHMSLMNKRLQSVQITYPLQVRASA